MNFERQALPPSNGESHKSNRRGLIKRALQGLTGRNGLVVLAGFFVCVLFASSTGQDWHMSFLRALGLDLIANRVGAKDLPSTSMRSVDLILEAKRRDTGRYVGWKLRVPAAYVVRSSRKSIPEESDIYHLRMAVDSGEPTTIRNQRVFANIPAGDKDAWNKVNQEVIRTSMSIIVASFSYATPGELARNKFLSLDGTCSESGRSEFGLKVYTAKPAGRRTPNNRLFCMVLSSGYVAYAAGSTDEQYEIAITCLQHNTILGTCTLQAIVIGGWAVEATFHGSQIGNWRIIVKKVAAFLEKHTIENTAKISSTNISWL